MSEQSNTTSENEILNKTKDAPSPVSSSKNATESNKADEPGESSVSKEDKKDEAENNEQETAQGKTDEKNEKPRHEKGYYRKKIVSGLLKTLVLALIVYFFLFHFIGVTLMPNGDMFPRIDAGNVVVFYRIGNEYKAQEIVVIDKPLDEELGAVPYDTSGDDWFRKALDWIGFKNPKIPPTSRIVSRVVAGPGDKVEITENNQLMVNGSVMIEANIFYKTVPYEGYTQYPVELGENEYFVLSDFRKSGVDSRFFGIVTADEIKGSVILVIKRNNL